jgi:Outer membrane protein beta-barrel domain
MKLQQLIYTLLLLCMLPAFSTAQGLSYGFKVGLNFSNMPGELEQDADGENIERLKTNTGFHVGASVRYNFTDRYGIKGDFLYSQKGAQQYYDGQAAQLFYVVGSTDQVGITGTQERFLRITNSYIEIPISGYAKFGKVEFFGGPYIGFLVTSKAVGDYQFTTGAVALDTDLNFNYFKDEIPDPANLELTELDYTIFSYFGQTLFYPNEVTAYYDFQSKDGKSFKSIDLGLNAGMAFYLNKGLYVSANLNYGLVDVTNDAYDHSYSTLNETNDGYVARNDADKNFSVQASVGFSF